VSFQNVERVQKRSLDLLYQVKMSVIMPKEDDVNFEREDGKTQVET